jgi:hypothetical protein
MMLVAVGVLALVGANTLLVRRRNEARLRLAAVAAAANRLSQLASGPCATTAGAATTLGAITERWSVAQSANSTRDIVDSVNFGAPVAHVFVLRTRLPC